MAKQRPYGGEPTLSEALNDPIVQQVMLSDGLTRGDVLRVLAEARQGLLYQASPLDRGVPSPL